MTLEKQIRYSKSNCYLTCHACNKTYRIKNLTFYHRNYDNLTREVAFICLNEKCKTINRLTDTYTSEFWRELSFYSKHLYICYQYPTKNIS